MVKIRSTYKWNIYTGFIQRKKYVFKWWVQLFNIKIRRLLPQFFFNLDKIQNTKYLWTKSCIQANFYEVTKNNTM